MSVFTLFIDSETAKGERRFEKGLSVFKLKQKLEIITGISASTMTIEVMDKSGSLVTALNDDSRTLNTYAEISDYCILKVLDSDPFKTRKNEWTDVSRVEKYEISETDYEKRADNARSFLRNNKLGKYNPSSPSVDAEKYKEYIDKINVGDRCEIQPSEAETQGIVKRGIVKFFGQTVRGYFVGVELDEPLGIHDGTLDSVRYFECRQKYGVFVRPDKVRIGDFPPFDIDDLMVEDM